MTFSYNFNFETLSSHYHTLGSNFKYLYPTDYESLYYHPSKFADSKYNFTKKLGSQINLNRKCK